MTVFWLSVLASAVGSAVTIVPAFAFFYRLGRVHERDGEDHPDHL